MASPTFRPAAAITAGRVTPGRLLSWRWSERHPASRRTWPLTIDHCIGRLSRLSFSRALAAVLVRLRVRASCLSRPRRRSFSSLTFFLRSWSELPRRRHVVHGRICDRPAVAAPGCPPAIPQLCAGIDRRIAGRTERTPAGPMRQASRHDKTCAISMPVRAIRRHAPHSLSPRRRECDEARILECNYTDNAHLTG